MKRYPEYKESDMKHTALINQAVTKGLDPNVGDETVRRGVDWRNTSAIGK